jgi:hypothetical protein
MRIAQSSRSQYTDADSLKKNFRRAAESLLENNTPPELVAICIYDGCPDVFHPRTRGAPDLGTARDIMLNGALERPIIDKLSKKYGVPCQEMHKIVFKSIEKGETAWISAALAPDGSTSSGLDVGKAKACPSTVLPMSPRMVSYWRRHPKYLQVMHQVLGNTDNAHTPRKRVYYKKLEPAEVLLRG